MVEAKPEQQEFTGLQRVVYDTLQSLRTFIERALKKPSLARDLEEMNLSKNPISVEDGRQLMRELMQYDQHPRSDQELPNSDETVSTIRSDYLTKVFGSKLEPEDNPDPTIKKPA